MRHLLFELKQLVLEAIRAVTGFCFYDNRCIVCSKKCSISQLCSECSGKIQSLMSPPSTRCSCCGRILLSEINVCTQCRKERIVSSADDLFPIHSYRLSKKLLLFQWKMADQRFLSKHFARAVWLNIKEKGLADYVVVPVPPRHGKIRKRGWDQIQELSSFLHLRYGMKICQCLERKTLVQQKKLDRSQRINNMGSSYVVKEKFGEKKPLPSKVLLLDDVVTTGVTVQTCAQALKAKGVAKVEVVSIFIVD